MVQEDPIFQNNPIYMKSLIGKSVEIKTVDNKAHSGLVYVIDPIFKTVVLHTNWKSDDDYETVIILKHAIVTLEVLSEEKNENYLGELSIPQLECTKPNRKSIVKKWIKSMMIDVKESGDYLKIDDYLVIIPPYRADNCICNNTIILERIQKILNEMPEDYS